MVAPLIWINAFPGTGKLTIARAMVEIDTSCIVVDNHQLIDPVAANFSRDHPQYQKERRLERQRVFQRVVFNPKFSSRIIIFTDFQSATPLGESVAREYQAAAQEAGRLFIPVYLSCKVEVNLERAASQERVESKTTKLTATALLEQIRSEYSLFQFEELPCFDIDTTHVVPSVAARRILDYAEAELQGAPDNHNMKRREIHES